jgi:hypothetical protein
MGLLLNFFICVPLSMVVYFNAIIGIAPRRRTHCIEKFVFGYCSIRLQILAVVTVRSAHSFFDDVVRIVSTRH